MKLGSLSRWALALTGLAVITGLWAYERHLAAEEERELIEQMSDPSALLIYPLLRHSARSDANRYSHLFGYSRYDLAAYCQALSRPLLSEAPPIPVRGYTLTEANRVSENSRNALQRDAGERGRAEADMEWDIDRFARQLEAGGAKAYERDLAYCSAHFGSGDEATVTRDTMLEQVSRRR